MVRGGFEKSHGTISPPDTVTLTSLSTLHDAIDPPPQDGLTHKTSHKAGSNLAAAAEAAAAASPDFAGDGTG